MEMTRTAVTPIVQNHRNEEDFRFKGVSQSGRKVSIVVTARQGTESGVVLNDVRVSMPAVSNIEVDDDLSGPSAAIAILFLWVCVFGVGIVASFLCEMADFGYRDWAWPESVPIVGHYGFWMGLFRLHVLGYLAIIPLAWLFSVAQARDTARKQGSAS